MKQPRLTMSNDFVVRDTKSGRWRRAEHAVSYRTAHARLGPVAGPCVDCGKPARDWSLRSDVPADRLLIGPRSLRYSLDPADYSPRCKSCHMRMDHAKVTPSLVEEIRVRSASGETCRDIAKLVGISESHVSRIARGKKWDHVRPELAVMSCRRSVLTVDDVRSIRARHSSSRGVTKQLAREYGISTRHVHHIVTWKKWSHLDKELNTNAVA